MENKKLEEQLKSVVYVTVGAAATIMEKAKEIAEEFEEKGKTTCEKCQVNNEELKRNMKEAVSKVVNVTVVKEETTDEFVEKMDQLTSEELTKIKEKLAALEAKPTTSEKAE